MKGATTCIVILAAVVGTSATAKARPEVDRLTVSYAGAERTYYLYAPPGDGAPHPAILLLHGSGHHGDSLVKEWLKLARKEKIVLIGPDSADPATWSPGVDSPGFLRAVVEDARGRTSIDPARIYLFGHSGGACWALQLALQDSEYYAAVAVHAGLLQLATLDRLDLVKRKISVSIQVGVRDALFPPMMVKKTAVALDAAGFPVEYVEIGHHDHDYYSRSKSVNATAWRFLSQFTLPR